MHSTKFYLKDVRSTGETLIYISVNHPDFNRIKLSTRKRIHPELWDEKYHRRTQSAKLIIKHRQIDPGIEEKLYGIQSSLDKLKREVDAYFAECSRNDLFPDPVELKKRLKSITCPKSPSNHDDTNVISYLKRFITEARSGKRKKVSGENFAVSTIDNYDNLLQKLIRFESGTRISLEWSMINRTLYYRFMHWQEECHFSLNYRGKAAKDLKALMRSAFEEGVHENIAFNMRWFAVPSKKAEKERLTTLELEQLHQLLLKHGSTQARARDFFLIGCYTGLRAGDISRISPEHIKDLNGRKVIEIITQKTDKKVLIPVSSALFEILERNDWTAPKIAVQTVNRQIKLIVKEVGLSERKAENISIHNGRYFMATSLADQGIALSDAMTITGHTSEANYRRYVNMQEEDVATRLQGLPLFS